MSTHEAYIEYAKSKLFLAWSLRSWSFRNPSLLVTAQNTIGLHKLQSRALRLKQRMELETKIYMAAGDIVTSEAPCDVIDTERCRGPPTTHISVANDPP